MTSDVVCSSVPRDSGCCDERFLTLHEDTRKKGVSECLIKGSRRSEEIKSSHRSEDCLVQRSTKSAFLVLLDRITRLNNNTNFENKTSLQSENSLIIYPPPLAACYMSLASGQQQEDTRTESRVVIMRSLRGQFLYYLQMDGVLYPPLPGYAQHLKQLQDFQCRPDDVWVFGYPKSGNHWLWEMVHMVLKGSPELHSDIMERYLVDFEDLQSLNAKQHADDDSHRVLVSHLPCQHAPRAVFKTKGMKIIYILRNPKDVAVSAYNHLASVTEDFHQLSFSEFLQLFMDGNVYYGDWYDHVSSWYAHSQSNPNVLIVKYEDMKKDLLKEVKRVAVFLGRPLDVDTAENIAHACSFKRMKRCKSECNDKWRDDGLIHSVYRKGEVGDWRNWFTTDESEEFDTRHRNKMQLCADLTVDFDI